MVLPWTTVHGSREDNAGARVPTWPDIHGLSKPAPAAGGGGLLTGSIWWDLMISVLAALVLAWLALVVTLIIVRPRGGLLREALRVLPDVLRLVRRLAADTTLPRGVRIRLGLLLAYLAIPIDLVPDFIPVLGYADDAIIVIAVLRSIVRRSGLDPVRAHWPGTDDGFAALTRLTGLNKLANPNTTDQSEQ